MDHQLAILRLPVLMGGAEEIQLLLLVLQEVV
jgi:hypothetical protein